MTEDPFAVLGIAPTMDYAAIKQAYFKRLPEHPPHADPMGFARLRAAYDALRSATTRTAVVLAAPLDLDSLRASHPAPERLEPALAAQAERVKTERVQERVNTFVAAMKTLSLDEAVAHVPK
jgi:hypothetical protein